MQRNFLLFLLLATLQVANGQLIPELEKRNGFKEIKLGMVVDSLKGVKFKRDFKEKNEFDAKLYSVDHPDYATIGEVDVTKIEVKTYKNFIYEILVITDKDTRLMKALESIYGPADYDEKGETYFWRSQTLILKFRPHHKNKLEMVYISYLIHNKMKVDKGKKVEDIADDF